MKSVEIHEKGDTFFYIFWQFLTHAFSGVTVQEQSVHPREGIICLAVQQVDCGAQDLHLWSDRSDAVTVAWQQMAYGAQLLGAVLDVPDLVVKVSGAR